MPLHIGVDVTSPEGVVFMKLANKDDAKTAFTALHGVWYSGTLSFVQVFDFFLLSLSAMETHFMSFAAIFMFYPMHNMGFLPSSILAKESFFIPFLFFCSR